MKLVQMIATYVLLVAAYNVFPLERKPR